MNLLSSERKVMNVNKFIILRKEESNNAMVRVVLNPEMWDLILKMEGLMQGTMFPRMSSSPLHPRCAECGAWRGGGGRTDLILPGRAARVSCCRVVVVTSSQTLPSPRVQPSSESTETPSSLPTHTFVCSVPLLLSFHSSF